MVRSLVVVIWIAVFATGMLEASASARTKLRSLDRLSSGPVSDGGRYAAWTADRQLVIYDVEARRQRREPLPDECVAKAAASTRILLQCPGPAPNQNASAWRIYHVKRSEWQTVATRYPTEDEYQQIGRYWIGGGTCHVPDTPKCANAYLNFNTGEYRVTNAKLDLNTPALAPYDPKRYDTVLSGVRRLVYRPKGNAREVVLSRCRPACVVTPPGISGTRIGWSEQSNVYAYDTKSGNRVTWRVSTGTADPGYALRVVPTPDSLLVAIAQENQSVRGFVGKLYEARL